MLLRSVFAPVLTCARIAVETATRASVIAADALVVLATWRNTYGISKLAHGLHMKSSITSLLLRDGEPLWFVRVPDYLTSPLPHRHYVLLASQMPTYSHSS